MRQTALQRHTPLKPSPLAKQSKKQGKRVYSWSKLSKLVREAAGHVCEKCGKLAHHAHHFRSKAAFPELRLEPRNLVVCCFGCHDWFHAHPCDAIQWLITNRPDDYEFLFGGKE